MYVSDVLMVARVHLGSEARVQSSVVAFTVAKGSGALPKACNKQDVC